MFNPPETRDEIRDTLYLLDVTYTYEKQIENGSHVFCFQLDDFSIKIYSPTRIVLGKERFRSSYEVKLKLMQLFMETA